MDKRRELFRKHYEHYDIRKTAIERKYYHSLRVMDLSILISRYLGLDDKDITLASIIGLLHDYARFEQWTKYKTYRDKDSIDHGDLAVKRLFDDNEIMDYDLDVNDYDTVYTAIKYHNKIAIPYSLGNRSKLFCKIIRDADKLDIFYVLLTDDIKNTYGCSAEEMKNETFSDEIINEFKVNHEIDYQKRNTYGDIWISHMAYVFDFYYKSSYIVIKEKDYINKLLKKVDFKNKETLKSAQEILQIANDYIKSKI